MLGLLTLLLVVLRTAVRARDDLVIENHLLRLLWLLCPSVREMSVPDS